jgi:hypothetical protein
MKILSAAPWGTTLVSPVTTVTPAARAAAAISPATRSRSAIGNPSSMINPTLRYWGSAPHMARSLTVPLTARSPMLPPGEKDGVNHIAVGGKGQALAADGQHSAVIELGKNRIVEQGQQEVLGELVRNLAAAAMI